jgi:hypothetical protein
VQSIGTRNYSSEQTKLWNKVYCSGLICLPFTEREPEGSSALKTASLRAASESFWERLQHICQQLKEAQLFAGLLQQ